jgi:dolichyl-phosphate-mannose-protein mannosyltransferase
MIHHNNALTKSHPYSSAPITWPFVIRGISFWETKEGLKQIYLLGNPFAWWVAIAGPFLYGAMWVIDRLLLRRGIDDFGPSARGWWDRAIGFLLIAWFLHWGPFFLMGRMLFLHHYMPAYIFSALATTALIDFLFRDFVRPLWKIGEKIPMRTWRGPVTTTYVIFACALSAIVLFGFYYFSPLCYGLGFPDLKTLRAHKWFPTWDLQYGKIVKCFNVSLKNDYTLLIYTKRKNLEKRVFSDIHSDFIFIPRKDSCPPIQQQF